MTDLRALREAAEKATPGPWQAEWPDADGPRYVASAATTRCAQTAVSMLREDQQADATFIALANPAAIIALLDRLKEAEEAIKAIDRHNDHPGFFNADIENVIRAHLERHNNE